MVRTIIRVKEIGSARHSKQDQDELEVLPDFHSLIV